MQQLHRHTPVFLGGRSLHSAQRMGLASTFAGPVLPPGGFGMSGTPGSDAPAPPPMNLSTPPVLVASIQTVMSTRNSAYHVS